MKNQTPARSDIIKHVEALGSVRQFLAQSPEAETPEILLKEIGGLSACALVAATGAIAFTLKDSAGQMHQCQCDPASFALLLLIIIFGQSVFIDRNERGGKVYIKVFGRNDASAGTVFARIILGCEEGETVSYVSGDSRDLRHANLKFGPASPRAERGTAEWFGEAQFLAQGVPDAVLPGVPGVKVDAARDLLHAIRERLHGERGALLGSAA